MPNPGGCDAAHAADLTASRHGDDHPSAAIHTHRRSDIAGSAGEVVRRWTRASGRYRYLRHAPDGGPANRLELVADDADLVDLPMPGGVRAAPRFAWRGRSLDVVRRFFTFDRVKHVIDLLALYEADVLHLRLTGRRRDGGDRAPGGSGAATGRRGVGDGVLRGDEGGAVSGSPCRSTRRQPSRNTWAGTRR